MNPIADQCPPSTTTCPAYGVGPWGHLMTYLGQHLVIYLIVAGFFVFLVLRHR